MEPTPELIDAAELRRGDVILDHSGERLFAAFDLEHQGDAVTIWTAIPDQEAGQPPRLTLPATMRLALRPRTA